MSEIAAYSIFLENYRNEQYQTAIDFGRWIWKGMPQTIEGYSKFDLPRNLGRLIESYGGAAEGIADPSQREAYIDTALVIFDKVFTDLKGDVEMYDWLLDRGRFYQTHETYIEDAMTKAAQDYYRAFEMKPEELTKLGDGYYVQVMLQSMVRNNKEDQALAVIEKAEPFAGNQLKDYFNDVRNELFDSPEERIAFLKERIQKNPKDQALIKELRDLYKNQGMNKEVQQLNEKLYSLEPNYENTMAMAEFAISNAQYDTAINYLKEALGKTQEAEEKAKINLQISEAYLNKENLQQARSFARQAAQLDPDWGQPYVQIATVYAQAVNQCTSGRKMEREDRVVYWLVLDYLDKAKSVDSSVASSVDRQYQSYQPVVPTTEDKFFKGWKTGQTMKIDASLNQCYDWVDETTTVR
jgi:tetratricopeptide (TPR) repeat protein